ncbi:MULTISPECIES: hypothetical protein [unclassified Streptomyces]|uniref:hypothetical protein n=1 Tax=unclassified Streptomyces TaxID=2593676 RepID=UPI001BEC6D7A|nr:MULTISPECIES: hypothetical protein [unclassified Streptomyces]MBT2408457.1 hypothetical protein [Streptomyces sp. ISL-21]
MSRATGLAVSATGTVDQDPNLPADWWWAELRRALAALSGHHTDRACMRHEHLTGRIREVYSDTVDTTITDWACAHGDIGWANLTDPTLTLLDWEGWGRAPVGYDAACLRSASLPVPTLAARVLTEFHDVLDTRADRLSRLMPSANVERARRRSGKTTPLTAPAQEAARQLLASLT